MVNRGAINVFTFNTNIQSQDECPIRFVDSSTNTYPIFSLDSIDQIKVNVTFENNNVGSLSMLGSIYSDVFYVCSWYPNTLT